MKFLVATLLSVFALSTASTLPIKKSPVLTPVGNFSVYRPGFLSTIKSPNSNARDLYISSFHFAGEDLFYVPDFTTAMKSGGVTNQLKAQKIASKDLKWPNEVEEYNQANGRGIIVSGGFLVPFHDNGGLYYAPLDKDNKPSGTLSKITGQPNGWFYHRVRYLDMNNDGVMDIVTCRGQKPTFGSGKGALVFLTATNPNDPTALWKETVISNEGCDFFFEVTDLNKDGKKEIIYTSFFGNKLVMVWSEDPKQDWSNTKNIKTKVLDDTTGSLFDLQLTDLNGDGNVDLLVSNHQGNNAKPPASVYAFDFVQPVTIPPTFKRHTLVSGIPTRQSGIGQASPGGARVIFPTKEKTGKPDIVIAGDGSQRVHYLRPKSQDSTNWEYESSEVLDCGCTVGAMVVEDMDGDGVTDVIVPCYDNDRIVAMSYQ